MSENQEAFIDVYIEGSNPNECNEITCDVTCYRGNSEVPRWTDLERGE